MQTLGISDSTPASESRLKNIFWPSIRTGTDVDTLGSQGYWVCVIVAVFSCVSSIIIGNPIAGVFLLLYYYMGGVGVRQHSFYAAVVIFMMFFTDTLFSPGILKGFGCVLLLSVMRATFLASFWDSKQAEAERSVRFSETWGDKFADSLPAWLWPKVRIAYYVYSSCFLVLVMVGLAVVMYRRHA